MSFCTPKWDSSQNHYTIDTTDEFRSSGKYLISVKKDSHGNTGFADEEEVHDCTDSLIQLLITEGAQNSWFSKLPSHEQLMKRVRHSFAKLALANESVASLLRILMTPKLLTLVWMPEVSRAPPLCIDDSESESDAGTEPELQESSLPPVALRDVSSQSQEAYLLSRLRAAKARVEEERTRMQYFETTGRMPPDSESEEEEEE